MIIPDLHLMTKEIGNNWYSKEGGFNGAAEFSLLNFAQDLSNISALRSQIKIIQIGDCYDLWVGYGFATDSNSQTQGLGYMYHHKTEPLYEPNSNGDMRFRTPPFNYYDTRVRGRYSSVTTTDVGYYSFTSQDDMRDYLVKAIKDIQGTGTSQWAADIVGGDWWQNWFKSNNLIRPDEYITDTSTLATVLNPAEAALRLLEKNFKGNDGGDGMNYAMVMLMTRYLIDAGLTSKAKITRRKRLLERKALFVEHAHRMEALFGRINGYTFVSGGWPTNDDGAVGGFELTKRALYVDQRCRHGKV